MCVGRLQRARIDSSRSQIRKQLLPQRRHLFFNFSFVNLVVLELDLQLHAFYFDSTFLLVFEDALVRFPVFRGSSIPCGLPVLLR